VLYDEALPIDAGVIEASGRHAFPLPLSTIAQHTGGSRVMTNTALLGAAAGVTGYPTASMEQAIRENFAPKGGEVVEKNLAVLGAARQAAQERFAGNFSYKLSAQPEGEGQLLVQGNQALAFGSIAAGCRFISAYPMTPGTTVLEWLTAVDPSFGVVTKHTEDELAAIAMAIGAGFAGTRAMTTTSGGGLSLMVEGIGFAGMAEIPVVIVDAQRGGPSTGLPTRTEQSDLSFVLSLGHGEFPRVVLAPGSIGQCFEAAWRAFNFAEKYQCPVFILTDAYLASALRTFPLEGLALSDVRVDRGKLINIGDPFEAADGKYERFQFTADGISPRALPGNPATIHSVTSDEHTPSGHISEEAEHRVPMMDKRMRKLSVAAAEMRAPRLHGPEEADVTLLCWGSTYMICREAVELARSAGSSLNLLQFTDLWPFPMNVAAELQRANHLVLVEQNFSGQLGRLIRQETGISAPEEVLKYDGRPFSPEEILDAVGMGVASP
jgi:2-oxoglutarate ferredoxin oxidoreductase subunit alpha